MSSTKRNVIYQTAYQILALILPFITAPYVSRVLGSENVGIYSYTYTNVNYFMLAALLGIETYGTRTVSKVRNDKKLTNEAFSSIFYCHLIVSAVCLVVYLIYACFISKPIYRVFALIQTLYIIAEIFNINWFFFGMEQFKITVTRNMVVKLLTIASIFLFVKDKDDLVVYITIMALGTFISQSFVWIFLRKYARFVRVPLKEVLKHFKPMCVLFVSVIATSLYRMISKTMLGMTDALSDLGCFEYADKIIRMPLSIITAVGMVMLSKTSNMYNNDSKKNVHSLIQKSMEAVMIFASAIAFGLAAVSDNFSVLFYGKEYEFTGTLILSMSASLLFMSWNNVIRTQYLMPQCKDKEYVKAVWAGAIVNVALNLVLIHFIGALGAALTTNVSYFVVSLVQTYYAKKELPVSVYLKGALIPFLTGAVMFVIIRVIGHYMTCSWVTLCIQIACGALFYCAVMVIYLKCINSPVLKMVMGRFYRGKKI